MASAGPNGLLAGPAADVGMVEVGEELAAPGVPGVGAERGEHVGDGLLSNRHGLGLGRGRVGPGVGGFPGGGAADSSAAVHGSVSMPGSPVAARGAASSSSRW